MMVSIVIGIGVFSMVLASGYHVGGDRLTREKAPSDAVLSYHCKAISSLLVGILLCLMIIAMYLALRF